MLEAVTDCQPAYLDELIASGLLSADGDGGWLKFRHEIARLAVEQAIAPHRAGAMHASILAGLLQTGCDDDARLAFHAEAAGDRDAVLRFAPAAARNASELAAPREAAAQFERALRFAAEEADAVVAALQDRLADQYALVDRWEESAQAGQRALDLWRRCGDGLREGDTLRRLARSMWRLCRGEESGAAGRAAVEVLEPLGPTAELAWAYANLAGGHMLAGQNEAAIDLAHRAAALAESLGVPAALSEALNTEGCCRDSQGGDGVGLLRRALRVALDTRQDGQAGRAFTNLYTILCVRREFAEADQVYRDGIAFCDERDVTTYGRCLRGERAAYLEKTGQWTEAAPLAAEMIARSGGSPINRLNPLLTLGKIRARRGENGAWACLDEAARSADAVGDQPLQAAVRIAVAEAHWLQGEAEAARRLAEEAAEVAAGCDPWDRGQIAVWLRRTGSSRVVEGELAEPYALAASGEWAAAARLWDELGCPFEAAMARLGSADDAGLRSALAAFDALGATATGRVARQQMRTLGIRSVPAGPRTATRADPLKLTRREREVLDLICAGNTNAQIAERLFISVKTVDHHVSAVLAKLDVPSRDAATQAVRAGLVASAGR